ncbi:MAG: D-alanyl-D-alanine carboxypeptidase family protein, partial [Faecalibacillus sp.]
MGLFKKKTDYSYYSSYGRSKRRLRVGRTAIAIIAAVVVIVGLIVYLNFNRIQFLMKGYSWSTTSELVKSFDSEEEKELLSHDEMKHILKWIDNSNKVTLYDEYEQFYALHKDMAYDDIVDVVNYIFENQAPSLKAMGYSENTIWTMLKDGAGKSDLQYLIDKKLKNNQTAPYRKVKGYHLKKMEEYIAQYNT